MFLIGKQLTLDNNEHQHVRVDYRCQTYATESNPPLIYDLPDSVLAKVNVQELQPGVSILHIRGAIAVHNHIDGYFLDVDEDATVEVRDDQNRRVLEIRTQGTSTVLVVLVRSSDSVNSLSQNFTAQQFFARDQVSFASQYDKCSAGKMQFVPADYVNKTTGETIVSGVGEMFIDTQVMGSVMTFGIENMLSESFMDVFGNIDNFDHVLFCMPAGMNSEWIGYTYGMVTRSYFNDDWCGYYSLPFHEVSVSFEISPH
jgi:hypothetical protein